MHTHTHTHTLTCSTYRFLHRRSRLTSGRPGEYLCPLVLPVRRNLEKVSNIVGTAPSFSL